MFRSLLANAASAEPPFKSVYFGLKKGKDKSRAGAFSEYVKRDQRMSTSLEIHLVMLTYSILGCYAMVHTAVKLGIRKEGEIVESPMSAIFGQEHDGIAKHPTGKGRMSILLDNLCEPIAVLNYKSIQLSKRLEAEYETGHTEVEVNDI